MLYPVMTESRMLFDLSGIWTFKTENEEGEGKREQWYASPLSEGCTMPVKHPLLQQSDSQHPDGLL